MSTFQLSRRREQLFFFLCNTKTLKITLRVTVVSVRALAAYFFLACTELDTYRLMMQ